VTDWTHTPRYPIYIPTKGRHEPLLALTARFLMRDKCPFRLVVEPQEAEAYSKLVGDERVLVLPFSNLGQGSIPARNWIWEHALSEGHERHWVIDDNCRDVRRLYRGRRIPARAGIGFRACEDFTDRYENIAISGLNYQMFVTARTKTPFFVNAHVYSCILILSSLPYRWRGRYNEDTDLCLQALAGDWCTVLLNAFMIDKMPTMKVRGGNTDQLYADVDSRLEMARSLERMWPGVVRVDRRYGRPAHVVDWKRFKQPLKLKPDVDLKAMPKIDERGMQLKATRDIKSEKLRDIYAGFQERP
jgi:hypothetical protein